MNDKVFQGSTNLAAIESMIAALAYEDRFERQDARKSLVEIGEPAVAALIKALADPSEHLRWQPAKTLSENGPLLGRERGGRSTGAYLVYFPGSQIATFIPLGFFYRLTWVPATVVLGLWFLLQLFEGVMSFGGTDVGGVAVWAHVGGFVAGMALALLLTPARRPERAMSW